MGLKTTNYVSKSTGISLPVAYAVLKNLIIESDNRVRAIFSIQANREATTKFQPIDKVEINFKWDRKTNPAQMAYEMAKTETRTVEKYNSETGELYTETEYGMLYGWLDDIV